MPKKEPSPKPGGPRARPDLAVILFLTLLGSYAYFWQSRDWNSATRLMLTYALGDRHQLEIDGLEQQAGQREYNRFTRRHEMVEGDLAHVGSHYYTDKAPGQSLLGLPVYAIGQLIGLPEHQLNRPAIAYWPADYFVTLGTSGVSTAALAVIVYAFSLRLGASHFAGMLLAVAYGLGTPAFLYATLFYGHQAAAFCTVTSFFLLYRAAHEGRANVWNMLLAGLLAGYSVVVEYQTAGISGVLALYALLGVRRARPVFTFLLAAVLAAGLLAAYNYRAFGDPLELSYAHEVSRQFRAVHSRDNPLGLRLRSLQDASDVLKQLLWGRYRGLTFYAPITLAAPLGLIMLLWRRHWGVALVALAATGWMLAVNVSYPLWQGGWCTGPRFLVPAMPFAVLAAGGLFCVGGRGFWALLIATAMLAGAPLMLACVSVGGRFPPDFKDPVLELVRPHLLGDLLASPVEIAAGRQFEWNLGRSLIERYVPANLIPPEPSPWQALQMAPLAAYWLLMFGLMVWRCWTTPSVRPPDQPATTPKTV